VRGENVIAVTLANYGPAPGLNKGVALRLQDNPAKVAWNRSLWGRPRPDRRAILEAARFIEGTASSSHTVTASAT
jgi:hypothetical protein